MSGWMARAMTVTHLRVVTDSPAAWPAAKRQKRSRNVCSTPTIKPEGSSTQTGPCAMIQRT
eukprot:9291633-Lingulodinium_polyedra.AAC.1